MGCPRILHRVEMIGGGKTVAGCPPRNRSAAPIAFGMLCVPHTESDRRCGVWLTRLTEIKLVLAIANYNGVYLSQQAVFVVSILLKEGGH